MNTIDGKSHNIVAQKLEELKQLFPEIFAENTIDFEKLKTIVGEDAVATQERYRIDWAGKNDAYKVLQQQTSATLVPTDSYPADKQNLDGLNRENIFIEGENLEVLKVLQKSYFGKVKMIYIDPPYNTGNDSFIYPDKFSETKEEYLKRINDVSDDGYLMKEGLFRPNRKENGQYHSNWLSMILPRLYVARNLLRDDGVIFVSIDDNEVHNLRLVMNEVFGEENFVGQWNWYKSATPPNLSTKIKKNIEYILGFEKHRTNIKFKGINKGSKSDDPFTKPQNSIKILRFPKNSINIKSKKEIIKEGIYGTDKFPNKLLNDLIVINNLNSNEVSFENRFVWTQDKLDQELSQGTKINLSENLVLSYKKSDYNEEVPPNYIDLKVGVDTTENAGRELMELFKIKVFDYPKPVSLIKYLANFICDNSDLILDFFAGSGTTAQAVMELNQEDGGNRRFICVQLPEKTEPESDAYKAGYTTISQITQARIKKVIDKIKKETEGKLELSDQKKQAEALGFTSFRLVPSNFKKWRSDLITNEDELNEMQSLFEVPQKTLSTQEQILWELLIKSGFELTVKIEKTEIDNCTVYRAENIVYLLHSVTETAIDEILKLKPKQIVCLDSIFHNQDSLKTNIAEQCKQMEDNKTKTVFVSI